MTSVFSPETDPWYLTLVVREGSDAPTLLSRPMTLTPRLSWMLLPLTAEDRRSNCRWSLLTETGAARRQEESCVRVKGRTGWVVWGLLLAGAALLHGEG